ncbi:MAG: CAP domain-containing protein [Candidatus Microsaccharimonas sp.]
MTTQKQKQHSKKKALLTQQVVRHAKKIFIPHKHNDYRPHLIRLHGIVAVLVIALAAQLTYSYTTTGRASVLGQSAAISISELLSATNDERQKAGLVELRLSDQLSQAAFLKANDMFSNQYWSHVSPSGVQPWKWLGDVGYSYSYAGENLAKNYSTAPATVAAWMNSPTHRENVLKTHYTEVGFAVREGVLEGKDTTIVVALYASPASLIAQQASSPKPVFVTSLSAVQEGGIIRFISSLLIGLSPVTIAVLALLAVVAVVGIGAHHYRNKLPKAWKKTWRVHHGLYTFAGMILLGVLIIIATSGGSI